MIKIKLNITGAHPPFRYRLKGSAEWQDSNVFEVPVLTGAGSYTFEVIDDTDCIKEITLSEQKLELQAVGATSHTGSVITRWRTTELAESRILWGFDDQDISELELTNWNNNFINLHRIPFPISFVGSLHVYKAYSRTPLGQYAESGLVGLYALGDEVSVEYVGLSATAEVAVQAPEHEIVVDADFKNDIYNSTVVYKNFGLYSDSLNVVVDSGLRKTIETENGGLINTISIDI